MKSEQTIDFPPSVFFSKPIENQNPEPFETFIENLKQKIANVFHNRADVDQMALKRGMPPFVMREILSANPLSVVIPVKNGGRGGSPKEILSVLSAASYESLSLSLTFGISMALFLQPVIKYGHEDIKPAIFERFMNQQNMGGLMITEPGHGSDALNMQTFFTQSGTNFKLKGTKHWAGLTGWAEYWLLTARERAPSGDLKRDINFFVCDVNSPGQQIVVDEVFENLGLYQIPYGRNLIDVSIPAKFKLQPHSTGIKMLLDLLHRSRMQFPGMAMGFIQRLLDESLAHTQNRKIGGKSLFGFDQVQQRLSKLQSYYTICSALCARVGSIPDINTDLSENGFEANSIKTIATDMMQEAAQSALQLFGANAYKLNHIAGRSLVDSRPFQIFEGSNDILYAQISESFVKMMKKAKESNLYQFLKSFSLTSNAASYMKNLLEFDLDTSLPQRKLVELGQILSRLVSSEMVIKLGHHGFNNELISNCLANLKQEISSLVSSYGFQNNTAVVEDYLQYGSWSDYTTKNQRNVNYNT